MWLLIAWLSIAVVVLSERPAWGAKIQVLPSGQVVVAVVGDSEATAPVNGELRGPDSDAVVTAAAWPYEADGYVANAGDRLVAFTVEMTEWASSNTPTLVLTVDGSPESLDMGSFTSGDDLNAGTSASGTESYVASVPNATHQVDLALADGSLTQSFSLWSLTRAAGVPALLYEDPTSSSVTEQLGVVKTVSVSDDSGLAYREQVQVSSAELTAFDPDGTGTVAPNGHAYLELTMSGDVDSAEHNSGYYFASIQPISGSDVIFTSSNGRRYQAQQSMVSASPGDGATSNDNGMLDATYAFLVPASTRHGVVTIEPSTTTGSVYQGWVGGNDVPIHIGGPVRFSVGFGAPPAVARQPAPPWFEESTPPTGLPGDSSSSPSGLPISAALVLLALLVVAVLVARHRRASRAAPIAPEVPDAAQPSTDQPTTAPVRADAPDPTLRIEIMGPVRIAPVPAPPSEFARAFLTYVAVHDDRPRSVDDTQTALWPLDETESDVTRKTFLNYVSEVRRLVSTAHLPGNPKRAGYRLRDVTTDWHEFRALTANADGATGIEASAARDDALRLVRGVPFESELSRWFQWTDSEGIRTEIIKAVVVAAVRAHAECVHAGDLDGAERALRQGLRSSPAELTLWECLADVVQARGDRSDEARFWRDATAALDTGAVGLLRERVAG